MRIEIITEPITRAVASEIAREIYGDMLKGVVDIEREILALGGEYHMDGNMALIGNGSTQSAVWGFNLHLEQPQESWIEFRSLINIRPAQGNRGMLVESSELQEKIRRVINSKIT